MWGSMKTTKWVKLLTFLWTHKTGLFIRTVPGAGPSPCGRSPETGSWEHPTGRHASQASQTFQSQVVVTGIQGTIVPCLHFKHGLHVSHPPSSVNAAHRQRWSCFPAWQWASVRASLSLTFSKAFYQWEPSFGAQMREKGGLIRYCYVRFMYEKEESQYLLHLRIKTSASEFSSSLY